ncbi:hypothetical protein DLAC_01640 [Tieghemostelium lacteum]|uniref:Uncharacterized protein n=1 Tax=Tieghemostelium lacteum TaxID=361077 RepID=A0A152A5Y8_TIELA|nr:hypothetical protein DLAC_01640 [Tieghemostelium lacteum]|eukprot:KYR01638.1 hypothetical protein DLAC_01640 [Tieghemostelium lacteum]
MENIEELAHQILFEIKNNNNNSNNTTPNINIKKQSFNPFSSSFGIPSSLLNSPDLPCVPTSPVYSFVKLNFEDSRDPTFGNSSTSSAHDSLYNNKTNSNYNQQPPLPTMFSTGKNLIPIPNISPSNSLCSSTDSFLGYDSPSQSVPSSPPAFSKSYKHQPPQVLKSQPMLNQHHPIHNILNSIFSQDLPQQQQPTVQNKSSSPIKTNSNNSKTNKKNNNNNNNNIVCSLNECLLCNRGQPELLIKNPTWASIMRVVFFTLHQEKDKPFFSLKSDVYDFMTSHWDILCMNKKRSDNWHKQIQDMLSHSKNIFESGMDKYKQNGFWRLKQMNDPWVMPHKGSRKQGSVSTTFTPSSANVTPLQQQSSTCSSLSSSPSSFQVPSITTSPLMLSSSLPSLPHPRITRLFNDELSSSTGSLNSKKRSSIDMLISTSHDNEYSVETSPSRKKRLSDSGEIKNYDDENDDEYDQSDDEDELFIDDSK